MVIILKGVLLFWDLQHAMYNHIIQEIKKKTTYFQRNKNLFLECKILVIATVLTFSILVVKVFGLDGRQSDQLPIL